MVPDRRPVPRRSREGTLPLGRHCGIVEQLQPVPDLAIAFGKWDAASLRRAGWVGFLECRDELSQAARSLDRVDLLHGRGLAVDPPVDIPVPRIRGRRVALRDRHRDLERKERRQLR